MQQNLVSDRVELQAMTTSEDADNHESEAFLQTTDSLKGKVFKRLINYLKISYKKCLLIVALFVMILGLISFLVVANLPSTSKSSEEQPIWSHREMIYEIDVPMFRDSDADGIGDLQGLIEKLDYFQKNHIKAILLQASIFNASDGTFEIANRQYASSHQTDLLHLDAHVGSEKDFREFVAILANQKMHLIIDLPLASTSDHQHLSWYGWNSSSLVEIKKPCDVSKNDLGCEFYKAYQRLPLDFANPEVIEAAEARLRYWLLERDVDGLRVDLPLLFDRTMNQFRLALDVIDRWKTLVEQMKPAAKFLLFDIPKDLQYLVENASISYAISFSQLSERENLFRRKSPLAKNSSTSGRFWQYASARERTRPGMMHEISQRITWTIRLLMGGTPVILYGDELGLKQRNYRRMPWAIDEPYGGFSSCSSEQCNESLSSYDPEDIVETNVKSQEMSIDVDRESLLIFFRRLAKLRQEPAFQSGALLKGHHSTLDILWFIRQASGHRAFIIVIYFGPFQGHSIPISVRNLTGTVVPDRIYLEYQSFTDPLRVSRPTSINSKQVMIHPGSINIFWWPTN